jgi:hypothetical protein
MEQELVGDLAPQKESSREVTLFSNFLHEIFPMYLHYGMTYQQFWHETCSLAEDYRKAHEFEMQEKNQQLWYQGAYIYGALCAVAPLYSLKTKSSKAEPYFAEPFPLTDEEKQMQDQRKQGEALAQYMNSFMAQLNKEKEV